ncbi:MAG: ATP synthase F1 subunit delta [Candidatus Omnitrophica bacterium]|nr:ATP synthase F1 subunit delta [Candidatus Omnitrophota bacterium]
MNDNLEILNDRYATALYEVAKKEDTTDTVLQELEVFNDLWFCDNNFRIFLTHPFIAPQEKRLVIEEISRKKNCCNTILNFLRLLIDNNRGSLIHGIFLRYRDIYELKQNRIRVIIESPRPLSDNENNKLKKALSVKFKKDIFLENHINPNLIAGLYIHYRDRIFDNSIRVKLSKLREALA